MIATLLALASFASAQDPDVANRRVAADTSAVPDWRVQTYTAPDTALEILCAKQVGGGNDCLTVHIAASAQAGVMFRYTDSPDWFGEVRVAGEFRYGLLSGGYGLEGRLGSFWGVDRQYYRLTTGPDLIANIYEGQDYRLAPGIGVGWQVLAAVKPWETFWVTAGVQPAWMFSQQRSGGAVYNIADELVYKVGAQYRGGPIVGAGYTWRRNAGGLQHGFYVSGSF